MISCPYAKLTSRSIAEDEADPDRHQRVDGAEADRVDERLGVDGGDDHAR